MITFPAAYTAALKNTNIEESWLFQFYHSDESVIDFLGLSTVDCVVYPDPIAGGYSGQYYGVITDCGEIVKTIDLANSQASTGTLTITCTNILKNGKLSSELIFGTRNYINRKVKVYSRLGNSALLAECALLEEYILTNIDATDEYVTLTMEQISPWDDISIPNTRGDFGIYAPVTYGDFVQDSEANFYSSKKVFPCPYWKREANKLYFIVNQELTGTAKLMFYDKGLDKFIPITNGDVNTTTLTNIYVSGVPTDLSRVVRIKPTNNGAGNELDSPGNAWDSTSTGASEETTYAKYPQTGYHAVASTGGDVTQDYLLSLSAPEPTGVFSTLELHVKASVTVDFETSVIDEGDSYLSLRNILFGVNNGLITVFLSELSGADRTESLASATTTDIYADYVAANYLLDDLIQLNAVWLAKSTLDNETVSGLVYVHDVYLKGTIALDFTNEPDAAENFIKELKFLYCGADGWAKSYNGGSGTATKIHEIHRDLLKRYAGVDYADAYMDNWTALDTARTGWTCHWWQSEPRNLKEIIEQAQYEGCFIFTLVPDSDGSLNPGGRYIWVKDTYDAGDVNYTLTDADYTNIRLYHTDFKELKTSTTYNYIRHPAQEGVFLDWEEYTNSTARTAYNIATGENEDSKDLEFVTADVIYNVLSDTLPNDCIALYYDNINASPKVAVDFDLKNYGKSAMECGDIIKFNDGNITPFGHAWADLYFMIVELRRGKGNISYTAREVYHA